MDTVAVPPVTGAADLTPAWCTAALGLDGATVTDVRAQPVGTGQVADTVRLRLTYDRPAVGPATVIAKVPAADEASRTAAKLTRTYEIEASFYRDLAAELPVRTPKCHHAAHDPDTDTYVVLLEDVAPAEQGDQMRGCPVADIAAAVDELALLHGPRWDDETLTELAWLDRAQPEHLDGTIALVAWAVAPFLEQYTARLSPATVALVQRFAPHLDATSAIVRGP